MENILLKNRHETDINKNAVCDKASSSVAEKCDEVYTNESDRCYPKLWNNGDAVQEKSEQNKVTESSKDESSSVEGETENNLPATKQINIGEKFRGDGEDMYISKDSICESKLESNEQLLKTDQSFVTSLMSEALKVWYDEEEASFMLRGPISDTILPNSEELKRGEEMKKDENLVGKEHEVRKVMTVEHVDDTSHKGLENKYDQQKTADTKEHLKELVKSLNNGEKLYRCHKCDSSFAFPNNLSVHIHKVHTQSAAEQTHVSTNVSSVRTPDALINPWNGLFIPSLFNMFLPPSPAFLPGSLVNPLFNPQMIGYVYH